MEEGGGKVQPTYEKCSVELEEGEAELGLLISKVV